MHVRHSNASKLSRPHRRVWDTSSRATILILHGTHDATQLDICRLTLPRTMLSYPLCPFFVVFCNVVGTSSERDFQLLQAVTDGISALVTENKYVNRLYRLCTTLLSLCTPLVNTSGPQDRSNMNAAMPRFSAQTSMQPSTLPSMSNTPDILNASSNIGGSSADALLPSTWNDDMMWQLFQSQPSLDWFNADILDPTWDFNVSK